MNAAKFIQNLRNSGYIVSLKEGMILISGKELDDNLRATLKIHKRQVLTVLQKEQARRERVIKMLVDNQALECASYCNADDTDDNYHYLALAVRDEHGGATCELLIPRAKVDIWQLMWFIQQHGNQKH
ncbi:MAG: hypothetical protein HOP20_08555 [Sulfuriferula sp.]|nr:hypothetical protein [Sulfuriferula sp.]